MEVTKYAAWLVSMHYTRFAYLSYLNSIILNNSQPYKLEQYVFSNQELEKLYLDSKVTFRVTQGHGIGAN